ncbi:unnamed protein product [Prunus armeniaca]|uniref:Uncharacterized protein n=1 Tax=Prunus armeniaca TaxID=36596 RepID=A0A6J5U0G8_PRUAR|nr:unnamed protein product [Prunus armeniaca]
MDGQVHDKNGQGSPSTIVTDGANEACFLGSAKAQDHGAPNTISWMPYQEPQHSFQPLLNPTSFLIQFQDLQVSNDIVRSQAMNLMINKPHTASNVDQTGDGIWNHGSIYQ